MLIIPSLNTVFSVSKSLATPPKRRAVVKRSAKSRSSDYSKDIDKLTKVVYNATSVLNRYLRTSKITQRDVDVAIARRVEFYNAQASFMAYISRNTNHHMNAFRKGSVNNFTGALAEWRISMSLLQRQLKRYDASVDKIVEKKIMKNLKRPTVVAKTSLRK
jgi:hypothetical protein